MGAPNRVLGKSPPSPTVVLIPVRANSRHYLIPFAANADAGTTAGALIGITVTDAVNERSLNLEAFEGIEEAVIDLYSAVRDGYQQRREAKIKE